MFLLVRAVLGTRLCGIFVANVKLSPLHMAVGQAHLVAQLVVEWLSEDGGA